jgi:hypothetical protein
VLALLRAGRPAPGRAPPRAIDCFLRLILFKGAPALIRRQDTVDDPGERVELRTRRRSAPPIPGRYRTPRGRPGRGSQVHTGLSAGGRWIRTIGPCREGAGLYEPSQDLVPLVSSWQLGGEPDENIGRPGAPGAPGMDVAQVTPRSGLRWRLR